MTQDTTDTAEDRAVSPVIGVILMVAITVILAAVIGTFVLNLGGQVQENVQAGASVSFSASDDTITVEFTSNQNADHLNVSATNQSSGRTDYVQMNAVGNTIKWDTEGNTTTGAVDAKRPPNQGGHNISAAGDSGTLDGVSYSVTVTAVKGDTSTVVVSKSDTL